MLFGSGMRRALYTESLDTAASRRRDLRMDEARRKTLQTLVTLWQEREAPGCYDRDDAANLLRSQSSSDELREIGIDDETIARIWPEE